MHHTTVGGGGGSVRAQFNKRNMETQYSEVAHKCIRDASSNRNNKTFPCQIEGKTRITDDRQYNSTGVHKTRGRYPGNIGLPLRFRSSDNFRKFSRSAESRQNS